MTWPYTDVVATMSRTDLSILDFQDPGEEEITLKELLVPDFPEDQVNTISDY
jgi:hypothetical protein